MYIVLILLSTNIHVDVISNCKYWEFIQIVSVLFLLFIVIRTQYYYVSFIILLYVCNYKYIKKLYCKLYY